ncbi:capsular polysaccharide synthesis protein [Lactobacillus sp. UMNPBX4]|uniref:capsular polysaccharide synthesis protein n=1 Tax=Lactobacillus sp. UMNPBX4 TaxID=2042043 RepID=UPI00130436DB|nr:capsular polysaccharide synthesis protein [Lactobacillus sp. UMNPBX4]
MNFKKYIKNFGLKIFLIKAIRSKFYDNYSSLGIKLSLFNEKNIEKFLQKNIIRHIGFQEDKVNYINPKVKKNNVIWTMWWQGIDQAPPIVKACIRKLFINNPDKKIIVITKDNFKQYVHLSSRILTLFENNNISFTHFSDIYRVNLLYLYGGVWVDSTVWTTQRIPNSVFTNDFFTINTGIYTNDPSHGRWTTFFLECKSQNKLMNFVRKSFDIYCNTYDMFMDYILFDYFIDLAIKNNIDLHEMINKIPKNNTAVFNLQNRLNDIDFDYNDETTYLYKLTYKMKFNENYKGQDTLYTKIIKDKV